MASPIHRIVQAAALLLVACVCSSCGVFWNIGDNIMQAPVTYTGVDLNKPVGGVVYRVGRGKDATYYMQAPEYTYKKRRPVVEMVGVGNLKDADPYHRHASGGKPTGKTRWVQVCMAGSDVEKAEEKYRETGKCPLWFRVDKECDGPPKGARAIPADHTELSGRGFSDLETRYGSLYTPASAVGAPVRYVVDPALTAVSTVAWYAVSIAIIPVQVPAIYLWSQQQKTE